VSTPRCQFRYHGAKPRGIVGGWRCVQVGPVVALSRQHVVQTPAMARMGMSHAANQAVFVGLAGKPREVLANANAGGIRVDGPNLAAKTVRSIGLEIPKVNVTWSPEQIDQYAGTSTAESLA